MTVDSSAFARQKEVISSQKLTVSILFRLKIAVKLRIMFFKKESPPDFRVRCAKGFFDSGDSLIFFSENIDHLPTWLFPVGLQVPLL